MNLLYAIKEPSALHYVPWYSADVIVLYQPYLRQVNSKEGKELRLATMLEF